MKRAVGFIIFRKVSEGIQYLLLQASNGIHHWSPPKGHTEPGETDMETAYRETSEESGIKKNQIKVYEKMKVELNYKAFGKEKTTIFWLASLQEPDAPITLSHEHQDFRWMVYADAHIAVQFDDMRNALEKCQEFIKKEISISDL